jgi:hypothetical protein
LRFANGPKFVTFVLSKGSNMNREDVEKLRLGKSDMTDITTGKPARMPVEPLPPHLQAEIAGGQNGYQYHLTRTGDVHRYAQNQFSRTPEAALQALKDLLNWDPL